MGMKQDERTFRTALMIAQIKQVLSSPLRKGSIEPVQFDALSEPPDLALEITKFSLTSGQRLQIGVDDAGRHRFVTIVALGDGGLTRVLGGIRNTISFGASMKWAEEVVDALQAADPSLEQV